MSSIKCWLNWGLCKDCTRLIVVLLFHLHIWPVIVVALYHLKLLLSTYCTLAIFGKTLSSPAVCNPIDEWKSSGWLRTFKNLDYILHACSLFVISTHQIHLPFFQRENVFIVLENCLNDPSFLVGFHFPADAIFPPRWKFSSILRFAVWSCLRLMSVYLVLFVISKGNVQTHFVVPLTFFCMHDKLVFLFHQGGGRVVCKTSVFRLAGRAFSHVIWEDFNVHWILCRIMTDMLPDYRWV